MYQDEPFYDCFMDEEHVTETTTIFKETDPSVRIETKPENDRIPKVFSHR